MSVADKVELPKGANGPFRVYHFAASVFGGAAIAARRFFDSLADQPMESLFFAGDADPEADPSRYKLYRPNLRNDLVSRLKYRSMRKKFLALERALPGRPEGMEQFHQSQHYIPTALPADHPMPDIVHLHWVSGMHDVPSFSASVPDSVPIVWTLHDMHSFTGGCHYAWECERYLGECGPCPQLNSYKNGKAAAINQRVKRKAFANKKIHLAADSHWLANEAGNSTAFENASSVRAIHYGLNFEVFKPVDKAEARAKFNLPNDVPVLAFGADSVDNKRKGLTELLEAINLLPNADAVHCIVFGRASEELRQQSKANLHFTGFVSSPAEQCAIYSAADVFVIPSLYEAFGQTSLEAMACETPVVGFNTGGIPDMVKPKETGLLAPRGDVQTLAEQISWMLNHPEEATAMGKQARAFAIENFHLDLQFRRYMMLYRRALGQV